jgi:hypothetical protein
LLTGLPREISLTGNGNIRIFPRSSLSLNPWNMFPQIPINRLM